MQTWRIPFKLVMSKSAWGAIVYALLLSIVCMLLEPWHFVGKVSPAAIRAVYGVGFPPAAAFLFAGLFAADVDELALHWLRALPRAATLLLVERWLIGMGLTLMAYFFSLAIVNGTVAPLPWGAFAFEVLVPALLLGHLAMLMTLVGKQPTIGLAVSLLYWVYEGVSRGESTGPFYLFAAAFGGDPSTIAENRAGLLIATVIAWLASAIILNSRYYNRRK